MKNAYPELLSSMNYISRVCLAEEERFAMTLSSGLKYFEQAVKEAESRGGRTIPGDLLFRLYDTFGFPLDLSQELAKEKGLEIDEPGFHSELEKQKDRARQSWKGEEKRKEHEIAEPLRGLFVKSRAYDTDRIAETTVMALARAGNSLDALEEGEEGEVILAETPFYAEAGGAVGESGWLNGNGLHASVEKAHYLTPSVVAHKVKVVTGRIVPGMTVEARVDAVKRASTSRNHTATHLLHAALRDILGGHVRQAGSLVSPTRLRFDFNHFSALSKPEIRRIEQMVNDRIMDDLPVTTRVTSIEEGLKEGAMAIFEEKYGEKVRVVTVEGFSKELCGGIHVKATGEIGLFKILSESSVAAGMRRIEAVSGQAALDFAWEIEDEVEDMEKEIGVGRRELKARIVKMRDDLQAAEKETAKLRRKLAEGAVVNGEDKTVEVAGIPLVVRRVQGLNMNELRDMADAMKTKIKSGAVVLGEVEEGKVFVVVSVTRDMTAKLKANDLIKEISPIIDGGGGGRPDFAQAGGKKLEELDHLLETIPRLIEKIVK